MSDIKDIEVLVKARYPLLYVVTHEEARFIKDVTELATSRRATLKTWSISNGFATFGNSTYDSKELSMRSPSAALAHLANRGVCDGELIVIMKDFHNFFSDVEVVRRTRDLSESLRGRKATVVFVSPVQKLPHDLDKEVYVVDYDLPSREEIQKIAEKAAASLAPGSISFREVVDAAMGLSTIEAENAFAKSIVLTKGLSPNAISAEKRQIIKKSGLLEYIETSVGMDSVGGHGLMKGWMHKRGKAFSPAAKAFGLPIPKGSLMVGPPGTGKSMLAKASACLLQLPLIRFDVGKVFGSLVGQSEANIRQVIKVVEACAPCVLWIDELEKAFAGSSGEGDSGTGARVLGSFLEWMQEKTKAVFVMATANNIKKLPPELLRKGRFDEIWFCDLPSERERKDIFKIHINNYIKATPDIHKIEDFDLDNLAHGTPGFSGAEIEQIVVSALFEAFDSPTPKMTHKMLVNEITEAVPLSRQMSHVLEDMRKWAAANARPTSEAQTTYVNSDGIRQIDVN